MLCTQKTKLQNFVVAYNDVQTLISIAMNPKSEDPDFGGSLVGSSAARGIQGKLRELVFGTAVSSPSDTVRGLRDLGITLQDDGSLSFDESVFEENGDAYFDEAVAMLSGTGLTNEFGASADGIAVRTNDWITEVISVRGVLLQNSQNAERRVADYEEKLVELESRMSELLDRYMNQFSVMQSIVGQISSMRTSLTSTFEGLASMYKK
jgi:flagellar hook-associated protein 2